MNWQDWSKIGNPEARTAEMERLDDPIVAFVALWDPIVAVRFAAAAVLARLDDESVRRWVVAAAIGDVSPGAREMFGDVINVERNQRVAATLALRRSMFIQIERAAIRQLANDSDANVRYHAFLAAHEALNIDEKRLLAASGIDDDDDDVAIVTIQWAAQYRWDDLFELGIERMRNTGDQDVKRHLAVSLAELGGAGMIDPSVIEVLDEGLRHEPSSRSCAIALASLKTNAANESLAGVLRRFWFHRIVRVESAAALAALGDERGIEALQGFATSRHEDAANYALERVGHYKLTGLRDLVELNAKRSLTETTAIQVLELLDRHE